MSSSYQFLMMFFGPLHFQIKLRTSFSVSTNIYRNTLKTCRDLTKIALGLQISCFDNQISTLDIFAILSLSVYVHRISSLLGPLQFVQCFIF